MSDYSDALFGLLGVVIGAFLGPIIEEGAERRRRRRLRKQLAGTILIGIPLLRGRIGLVGEGYCDLPVEAGTIDRLLDRVLDVFEGEEVFSLLQLLEEVRIIEAWRQGAVLRGPGEEEPTALGLDIAARAQDAQKLIDLTIEWLKAYNPEAAWALVDQHSQDSLVADRVRDSDALLAQLEERKRSPRT